MTENTGRIAIVTGGGSGIGASAAHALAADGWTVVVAGRRKDALEQIAAAGGGLAGSIHARPADVTDETSVRSLFEWTTDRFGRLDLLFNNAGVAAPSVEIDELELESWNAVVSVNLTGAFLCTREAFRVMRTQQPRGGRIINNGSISAHSPRPRSIAYTATKHAITGLTKSTALDGRPFDIACGQIDIGNAATQLVSTFGSGTAQADGTLHTEPVMDVADVGQAIRYMASLSLAANVATMTVMATKMPFVGRG